MVLLLFTGSRQEKNKHCQESSGICHYWRPNDFIFILSLGKRERGEKKDEEEKECFQICDA